MKALVMKTKARAWGNSLAVRIPKKITDALNLHDGSSISISLEDGKIIIENDESENEFFALSKDLKLTDFTDKINSKNRPDPEEFATNPIGKEIW